VLITAEDVSILAHLGALAVRSCVFTDCTLPLKKDREAVDSPVPEY
jgi:hypothetical protein